MRFKRFNKKSIPSAHFHVASNSDLEALAPLVLKMCQHKISTHLHLDNFSPTRESQFVLLKFLESHLTSISAKQPDPSNTQSPLSLRRVGLRFNLNPRIRLRHPIESLHVFGPTSLSLVEFLIAKVRRSATVSMPHGFSFFTDDQFLATVPENRHVPGDLPDFGPRNRFDGVGVENESQRQRMVRWGIRSSKLTIVGLASLDESWTQIRDTLTRQRYRTRESLTGRCNPRVLLNWARPNYSVVGSQETQLQLLSKLLDHARVAISIHPEHRAHDALRNFTKLNSNVEVLTKNDDAVAELSKCQAVISGSSTLVAHAIARGVPVIYLPFLDRGSSELSIFPNVKKFESAEDFLKFIRDEEFFWRVDRPTKGNRGLAKLSGVASPLESSWRYLARTYETAIGAPLLRTDSLLETREP